MKQIFLKMFLLNFKNNILKINVKENPIIENININGIKSKKLKEKIRKILILKSRSSL